MIGYIGRVEGDRRCGGREEFWVAVYVSQDVHPLVFLAWASNVQEIQISKFTEAGVVTPELVVVEGGEITRVDLLWYPGGEHC